MDLSTLIRLCRDYRDLGDAITEQLHDMAGGVDASELNGNAVREIRKWLRLHVRDHLDEEGKDEVDGLLEEYSDEALKEAGALCA
jgi:hypothetical protein